MVTATNDSAPAAPASDRLEGVCPIDGQPREPVMRTPLDAIDGVVARARAASEAWRGTSLEDRISALETAAKAMLDDRATVLERVRSELGKADVDAMFTEALGPLDTVRAWAKLVKKHARTETVRLNPLAFPRKKAFIDLVPRGVVGVIAPWNFPVAGLYRSTLPALLTGNAIVVKPSEHSPRSSAWYLEHLAAALPEGLVGLVQGDGSAGEALVGSEVDALVFTGSARTGARVRVRCAEYALPCSIETGGNDGAIVLPDADLDRTAAGITQWTLQNAGQACGAIEVAYVDAGIADGFVAKLGARWENLRTGPGEPGAVDVAPLAHPAQLELVERHVQDALEKGATLVTGGARTGEGLSYRPTILDGCTDDMDVVREETFGPVLAVCRVEGPTEAIRRINAGKYGLTASLWTADVDRAKRLAERLDVGVVSINNHAMTGAIPDLPWSGTRDSGLGVANSRHGLSTFVRPKALLVDEATGPEPFWLPYDRDALLLGDILADAQRFRLERAWRLPGLLRRRAAKIRDFFHS